jgi:SnoaL-like domain
MRRHRRTWVTYAGLSLVALLLVGALSAYGLQAHATADPTPQDGQTDQAVVTTYFAILNAGMQSGDFSALATVYAPDATLTQSPPKGVTTVYSGIDAIIAWYQAFRARAGAIQFTQDSMRSLAPHVVLSYEHAGKPTYVAPGRCMHVFTLKGGLIETVDWATFYGGQPA